MAKNIASRSVRASRLSFELKDPPTKQRAVDEICKALKLANGSAVAAAKIIGAGVSDRQVKRWIELVPEIREFQSTLFHSRNTLVVDGAEAREEADDDDAA